MIAQIVDYIKVYFGVVIFIIQRHVSCVRYLTYFVFFLQVWREKR